MGRLSYARIFGGALKEGQELKSSGGEAVRIGTLFAVQGDKTAKLAEAKAGDVVAIAKLEGVHAGEWLAGGAAPPTPEIAHPVRNYALAIATRDRKDDVRLSTALHKLTEEDRALLWEQDEAMHETRLQGRQRRASQGRRSSGSSGATACRSIRASRRSATRNRSARPSPSAAATRSSRAATASSAIA